MKRQNGNGKRPFTVCPFPRASLSARVPLPLSLIGLRYNMEVAKRILTRSKAWERPIAPTVRKKSRRSRPQSSQPRLLSARLTSCGVAGSDRTVERRSAGNGETVQRLTPFERWNGKRFWKRFFDVYCIFLCLSETCNEVVRGDMGLDSLQGRRDKAKLKWWYK